MKHSEGWLRLAGAAAAARDELRAVIPRLDSAIAAGADSTKLLQALRVLAWKHADSLRQALKAPAGVRQPRKKADSWRTGGLWDVLETPDGGNQRETGPGP
jgi:hypothetical protein